MTDLAFRTATELSVAIRNKEVGSLELLDHFLHRIERLNPKVNAVVTLDPDRAREAAKAADNDLVHGEPRGLLHGLPITVKDSIETAGLRTTAGALELADHVPDRDADAVTRLRAAGAVIFGKTNLPRYAMDYQSYNELFGTTNNPWDPTRGPGGSSGGAAAALAAGLTGLELGSDIGGSIRVPAHFCGVCGLKPSYGIVPGRGHIPGPSGSLAPVDVAVLGPMGRSVEDLSLGLQVLAGPDDWQARAWRLELPPPRRASLRDYRIAAWLDDTSAGVATEVRTVLESASEAVRRAGANIDDTARPAISFAEAQEVVDGILMGAVSHLPTDEEFEEVCRMAGQPVQEDEPFLARRARQIVQRHRGWLSNAERRAQQRARWAEFFGDFDVLLCPVTCTAAFLHNHSDPSTRTLEINGDSRNYASANEAWCTIIGVTYLPSVVVPVGKTAAGLPVGIQVVGPYLEDRTALHVAAAFEGVLGGFEAPPGY